MEGTHDHDDKVSVFNSFKENGDGTYEIDYSSSSVKATLDSNGKYNSIINITNDVESSVGVLWRKGKGPTVY